jgi:uncharacterized membrane protein
MTVMESWKLIAVGFPLVLFGFVGPFLMVLGILPLSYALSFLSFGASVVGLFLGLIGSALYAGRQRAARQQDQIGTAAEEWD